ncbi:MAG: hypothetical protein HPY45_10330 [Anaerolineae bacterium]|nr:hypothetical protein [Anaerolineae bacterium]
MTGAPETNKTRRLPLWVGDILLVLVLLVGAYFRYVGIDWDDNHHLHPDERFLTMVETGISPVSSLAEYFDTAASKLNPHNVGFGFYVYGTFPIFVVRYLAEWLGKTGYDQVHLVGRYFSASVDLLTVFLVYLIALRVYRKEWLAILAAAFSALAVLQIQLSHYFTVDTSTNFFAFLAIYFAVRILTSGRIEQIGSVVGQQGEEGETAEKIPALKGEILSLWTKNWDLIGEFVLFGLALGLAVASKVSVVQIAVLLPLVVIIRYTQIPPARRTNWAIIMLRNLMIAALVSFLVFRIGQPYAFTGPGFFGLKPNEKWINNLKDLSAQSNGDVDFPPALQWARLPFGFAWKNMVVWGLGLPLGLLAWAGFLWMGWRMIKGEWRQHILLWGWTALYFAWQSNVFNPTMRYLLPVYPTLAIIAAWTVASLWDLRRSPLIFRLRQFQNDFGWTKVVAAILGAGVLLTTLLWAFAFTRIYTRPVTRVEASEWIYQNVPSAINVRIQKGTEEINQPISFHQGETVTSDQPFIFSFIPRSSGDLVEVRFDHIVDKQGGGEVKSLAVSIDQDLEGVISLGQNALMDVFQPDGGDPRGREYSIAFDPPLHLEAGRQYYLRVSLYDSAEALNLSGLITLSVLTPNGVVRQSLAEPVKALRIGKPFLTQFNAVADGEISKVFLPHIVDWEGRSEQKTIRLSLIDPAQVAVPLGVSSITDAFASTADEPRGSGYTFTFTSPVPVQKDRSYALTLELVDGAGAIGVYGSRQANESTWDDPLPVSLHGYSPFDYVAGLYRSDLNFEMYWDDNEDKRERFIRILDQADYIFISSNRQWGTTVRVPERYPMTAMYYRNLIGCPDDRDIVWCYRVADTDTFEGRLGFDLVKVSQSDPNIGSIRFNSQFAEEAFTVYDHPKVFIFKKSPDYDPDRVRQLFNSVDISTAIHITPRKTKSYPANLMLPDRLLAKQRAGGTWSDLFDRNALPNRYPFLGMLFWYIEISLLGWVVYPLTRLAFGGLEDKGYPLIKILGVVLLAFLVWFGASNGLSFSRQVISISYGLLFVLNAFIFYRHREKIKQEWLERKKYYLIIEGIAFLLFAVFILVRLGNPDLWHPYKGGEKPMDFSYLNAVLKSTHFPPYDPWFAGGYINYYYYGFVLIGVMVKWLGIIPSIAYNLILATWFSFAGMGAFCLGYNLWFSVRQKDTEDDQYQDTALQDSAVMKKGVLAGSISAVFYLILGNLGTVRMIWQGFIRLSSPVPIEELGFLQRWMYSFDGLKRFINGAGLPYGHGDWYWIPSRVIPGEPITEFPFFTFLYADPHAHLIALPLTLLALSWVLSIVFTKLDWMEEMGRSRFWRFALTFVVGAVIIGSLRPTNTWDYPTFLALGGVALVYVVLAGIASKTHTFLSMSGKIKAVVLPALYVLALVVLSAVFYSPFSRWFGQAYNQVDFWKGDHTPLGSYITHWGLFLFAIVSWMFWETLDWMAKTPLSALNKLRPYKVVIQGSVLLLLIAVAVLLFLEVKIAWLVLPICFWAAVLLLRPGMPLGKRCVLFLVGTGLVLTLLVELVVLRGDIGRMNTVFKFYLQAWAFLSVSAAAAVVWVIPVAAMEWSQRWRTAWTAVLMLLIGGAALFPLMGGADKIRDRISNLAPHTLDGMAYMKYSYYSDFGVDMDLSQDYRAIIWLQDHVKGSPVIVEANIPEYRWGTRYTIYTGLPGVVGWNWHQRQQRAITATQWVTDRVAAVEAFYRTLDRQMAKTFLSKYDVSYVIVGQLERAAYPEGVEKFDWFTGDLWEVVYQDLQTTIYRVIR